MTPGYTTCAFHNDPHTSGFFNGCSDHTQQDLSVNVIEWSFTAGVIKLLPLMSAWRVDSFSDVCVLDVRTYID